MLQSPPMTTPDPDSAAARALILPFDNGLCPVPTAGMRVLRMNARLMPDMERLCAQAVCVRQQDFRPWALPFMQDRLDVVPDLPADDGFDIVMIGGRKQQDERRAQIAAALLRVKRGGLVICAAANDAGGKRLPDDFAALGLDAQSESKHHCRITWATADGYDRAAAAQALESGAARAMDIDGHLTWTQPGLFGWDRRDRGSELLLRCLPDGFDGAGADLGCGTGLLARAMLARNPAITEVACVDADARAVAMTARNIDDTRARTYWLAVGDEILPFENLRWVVMNPPFHAGKTTSAAAGVAFIAAAAKCLRAGGVLWMVANAHLPYEAALGAVFRRHEKIAEEHGFKVYKAIK